MIPIEKIKELAEANGMTTLLDVWMGNNDQLQAFAHTIEAMTIDRCALTAENMHRGWVTSDVGKAIRALKDKD